MKLSRVERWILSSQYRILEILEPDEAESYSLRREALDEGYELEYEGACRHIYDEQNGLTEAGYTEVIGILDMYSDLRTSFDRLSPPDRVGIGEDDVKFDGFDGKGEGSQLRYARYLKRRQKWSDLLGTGIDDLNSHMQTLEIYRRMLSVWRGLDSDRDALTRDEILRVVAARIHPSN